MKPDEEGFLYPHVNEATCINCGLCLKVCPFNTPYVEKTPLKVYAAKNQSQEIKLASSSGGIFNAIAAYTIAKGGAVFGARFDENLKVIHDYVESEEDIPRLMGSKYVQSEIGNTYKKAEAFLKEGRFVTYSGTPCQIAGLKHYLKKDYNKLICVDIICHGVPSPFIWKEYLELCQEKIRAQQNKDVEILNANFRSKVKSWNEYALTISFKEPGMHQAFEYTEFDSIYMKAFSTKVICRPSCFTCKAKALKSHSDLTLGDYWGINEVHPHFTDKYGVSAIICNSVKGAEILDKLPIDLYESSYTYIKKYNPSVEKSISHSRYRELFWGRGDLPLCKRVEICSKVPFLKQIKNKLYAFANIIGVLRYYKNIKNKLFNK